MTPLQATPDAGPRLYAVVFSKDRPLQLQATLDSFKRHCQDPELARITVLYLPSTPHVAKLYGMVAAEHPAAQFLEERAFRQDLRAALGDAEHWLFLVDDTMFVAPFQLDEQLRALERHPDALGFSLRLGRNTTYCYPFDRAIELPEFSHAAPGILSHDWSRAADDFGYPLELSSSLYRRENLRALFDELPYTNPNTLEQSLAGAVPRFARDMPRLLCHEQSVAFANPLNVVQDVFPNRSSNQPEYSVSRLLSRFEQGWRIEVSDFDNFVPTACHQEVPLHLHRPSGGRLRRYLRRALASPARGHTRPDRSPG